jgi:hypothetical protein
MDAAELRFFLEDEEFCDSEAISPDTSETLNTAQHVMVKLLEVGGDCLHELLELQHLEDGECDAAPQHPVKIALLQQTTATVRMAARVAYFVNLESLLTPGALSEPFGSAADACGPAVFVQRLGFLCKLLRDDAEVVCFCTRSPDLEHPVAVGRVCSALSLSRPDSEDLARHCQAEAVMGERGSLSCHAWAQLQIVHWLAIYAGLAPSRIKVAAVEHLRGDGSTDHTAVLSSLRRLLGGNPLSTTDSALPLLAEQVAHLLFDNAVACIDKDTFADILQPFEDSGHADLYRNVVHPMVVVPSMVFLDSFSAIMRELAALGIVYPADKQGRILLEPRIVADGRTLHLRPMTAAAGAGEAGTSSDHDETVCWRVAVQKEVVAEARDSLNLFQLKGASPAVSDAAAFKILVEAWKAAAPLWSASSSADVFSELFLAARFLLLNVHNTLPRDWSCQWCTEDGRPTADAMECITERGGILLQAPQDVFCNLFVSGPRSEVAIDSVEHASSDPVAHATKRSRCD